MIGERRHTRFRFEPSPPGSFFCRSRSCVLGSTLACPFLAVAFGCVPAFSGIDSDMVGPTLASSGQTEFAGLPSASTCGDPAEISMTYAAALVVGWTIDGSSSDTAGVTLEDVSTTCLGKCGLALDAAQGGSEAASIEVSSAPRKWAPSSAMRRSLWVCGEGISKEGSRLRNGDRSSDMASESPLSRAALYGVVTQGRGRRDDRTGAPRTGFERGVSSARVKGGCTDGPE